MHIYSIGRMVYEVPDFLCPHFAPSEQFNSGVHGRLNRRINRVSHGLASHRGVTVTGHAGAGVGLGFCTLAHTTTRYCG
jgi:hypothetical protein